MTYNEKIWQQFWFGNWYHSTGFNCDGPITAKFFSMCNNWSAKIYLTSYRTNTQSPFQKYCCFQLPQLRFFFFWDRHDPSPLLQACQQAFYRRQMNQTKCAGTWQSKQNTTHKYHNWFRISVVGSFSRSSGSFSAKTGVNYIGIHVGMERGHGGYVPPNVAKKCHQVIPLHA